MKKILVSTSLFTALLVGGLLLLNQNKTLDLVIVHTNDHHGYCWANDQNQGGFAKQLTIIKKIRSENKNVFVLSGGDINTGAPESDLNLGEPSFKGMNLLGFNAMTPGNHEFDNPLTLLKQQGAWATFPFISTNVYDKTTKSRLFQPFLLQEINGLKIAILGFTTTDSAYISNVNVIKDIEFKNASEEARKVVDELKGQVDFFIAMSHLGFYPDGTLEIQESGDTTLAKNIPELSVIVGGHNHNLLEQPVQENNALILQAKHFAQYLGELHLKIDKHTKKIKNYEYIMHKLDENIPEDPEMLSFLKPWLDKAAVLMKEPLGTSKVVLDGIRENVRSGETNLGNLVTDAFRDLTKADVAIHNGGGIRASMNQGTITFGDIRRSFPFNNTIVTLNLTGSELLEVLNRSASLPRPAGGFLQVSGIKMTIKDNHIQDVLINGAPLDGNKVYSVAANDFTANGGDGYEMLKDKKKIDSGYIISGALKQYILTKKAISPQIEGRIKFN
ncbi:MAG: 5'-nucleotidase C-terminal domain-containing protein [Deltaproteobacteria bacterium]|nr:5'-nucleotidase C-terminal domain-containing protein [Deltaproteobacteria bacterium]